MAERSPYIQNIAWFKDLNTRGMLNMDPPYQRRSVWSDRFREDFIDTILLDYPAPAIFLFEMVTESGVTTYDLVDGKQRLMTIFNFIDGVYPVGDKSPFDELRGQYFESLSKERKIAFYKYKFSVEVLPAKEEAIVKDIFDRLNRNTAKLTPQELRHAKHDGCFITAAETLAPWLEEKIGKQFPRIGTTARKQMKDVEIVATLLLYLEEGSKSYSTAALDKAFADRDASWESAATYEEEFRSIMTTLGEMVNAAEGQFMQNSRFRNQADFYSLFAAIAELRREKSLPDQATIIGRLEIFNDLLEREDPPKRAQEYIEAARSASNDAGPRKTRISVVKDVILGQPLTNGAA